MFRTLAELQAYQATGGSLYYLHNKVAEIVPSSVTAQGYINLRLKKNTYFITAHISDLKTFNPSDYESQESQES